jgi:endoglucanase
MAGLREICLSAVLAGLCLVTVRPAYAAGEAPTPAQVEAATKLNDIVFFRERSMQPGASGRGWFVWGETLSGQVQGLESASSRMPSAEAARAGGLGLQLDLTIQGDNPAWRISIEPEVNPPTDYPARTKPFFDAYAYRPAGSLEFDVRGAAKSKGLGIAFWSPDPRSALAEWAPLDPYLTDTADWQHVAVPVAQMDLSNPKADLHIADRLVIGGRGYAGKLAIDLDNILLHSDGPEPERGPVRLDHVGYLPASRKIGLVAGSRLFGLEGRPFAVRNVGPDGQPQGAPMFNGTLKLRGQFEPKLYGEWVYEADFTPVSRQGRYALEVAGVGRSVGFYVHDALYDYLFYHLARFYFFQRNGGPLPEKNAFEWARGAAYTQPIPFEHDKTKMRTILHGWFDAGDARCFPDSLSVGRLMLAWEISRDKHFDGQLNIPESGNGVPDMLDQIRWQVEYYREMQLDSGACLGYVLPATPSSNPVQGRDKGWDNDPDPRHIIDRVDYNESIRIGACMAAMARNLQPYDPAGAAAYAAAAQRAWDWAQQNVPAAEQGRAPSWQNHVLWAAVEMWRLTGNERFHAVVRGLAEVKGFWDSNSWKEDSAPHAWVSYLLDPRGDPALKEKFRANFVGQLDVLFDLSAGDPYGVAVCPHGWYHSPSRMGETASLLLTAWKLTGQQKYCGLAEEYIHYVCGRNIYRLCDISNVAEETYSTPFNMYEWRPGREVWMPGYVAYMCVDHGGNLSRFVARRLRMTRLWWYFGEPAVGFNDGITAAAMMLMEGKRYEDLIGQGAFPGVKPARPGLPFAPTPVGGAWGTEPVAPGPIR